MANMHKCVDASMDSMAATISINFCEIISALLHTRIWAWFGRGFGCGSIKKVFQIWQNDFLKLFATWIEKLCHSKLSDPLEIRAAKNFQTLFTLSCLIMELCWVKTVLDGRAKLFRFHNSFVTVPNLEGTV